MAKLTEISDSTFKQAVLEAEGAVLVDYWAPWCGPCQMVHPILEQLNDERQDLTIVSVNVDENPKTAGTYGILSIPTLQLFHNGTVIKQIIGAMPKARLEPELDSALAAVQ